MVTECLGLHEFRSCEDACVCNNAVEIADTKSFDITDCGASVARMYYRSMSIFPYRHIVAPFSFEHTACCMTQRTPHYST